MPTPKTQKKAILFVSAGLGDALLLLPLAKILKSEGYAVSALITSPYPVEQLFEGSGVFSEIICIRNRARLTLFVFRNYRLYNLAIVNYFAASRSNLLLAKKLATMVHTNRIPENAGKRLQEGLVYIKPKPGIHDAAQNILLAGKQEPELNESLLHLPYSPKHTLDLPAEYIALQISAGNFIQTYKNWPVSHWIDFLKRAAAFNPKLRFIILGDANEQKPAEEIIAAGTGNAVSLAGKTNISQALEVIYRSRLFLGLDGGLLHVAASFGKPSFSLWGPSNPLLYGYERINPEKHRSLSLALNCAPCSAWINANTSRFQGPEQCPDRKCLFDLSPAFVFAEFSTFVQTHAPF